jgi:hypothetical protein
LIPNLIAFLVTVGLFFDMCRRYLGEKTALLGSALLVLATPLTNLTVVPWTTTPVLVTVTFLAWVGLTRERLGYWIPVAASLLLALTYASRGGGEVLLLLPLTAAILWKFRAEQQLGIKTLAASLCFLAGVGLNLYWTQEVFGSFVHPYIRVVLRTGFHPSRIPSSLWGALIYSGEEGSYWSPLFRDGFWLALAPVGLAIAIGRFPGKAVHLGLLFGLVASLLVIASYPGFDAEHLKFHCLHYLKMWFPVAGFYALLPLSNLRTDAPALGFRRRAV